MNPLDSARGAPRPSGRRTTSRIGCGRSQSRPSNSCSSKHTATATRRPRSPRWAGSASSPAIQNAACRPGGRGRAQLEATADHSRAAAGTAATPPAPRPASLHFLEVSRFNDPPHGAAIGTVAPARWAWCSTAASLIFILDLAARGHASASSRNRTRRHHSREAGSYGSASRTTSRNPRPVVDASRRGRAIGLGMPRGR